MSHRWWPGLRSLRSRLVVGVLAVAVLALVVSGVASVVLLRGAQLQRIDDQLERFAAASRDRPLPAAPEPSPGDRGQFEAASEFVAVFYDASGRRVGAAGDTSAPGPLLEDPRQLLDGGDPGPRTVPADGDAADWRVQVVPVAGGPGIGEEGGYAVIGVSLDDLESTVQQLERITATVAAVVLVGLAGLAVAAVQLGLRPLTDMTATAASIAQDVAGSPDGLATGLARRVPGRDPRTETGRLAAVLDLLLDRIGTALSAKQASEDRLRRFVADASHELRTPLTSVRGFAELSRRGGLTDLEGYARAMRRIEAEAVRMSRLVEDLLLLAQLDEQRELADDPVDLAAVARDAVVDAQARQPDRPIHPQAATPVVVSGDEHRLRQVVGNLVGNALAHTPESASLTVTVARTRYLEPSSCVAAAGVELPPGEPAAVLTVADTGPGVPVEHASRVFDRFYRAEQGRSRRSGGSGLGLSIVATLVEAHGGRVELASTPGAGATFRVVLPLPSGRARTTDQARTTGRAGEAGYRASPSDLPSGASGAAAGDGAGTGPGAGEQEEERA